MPGNYQMMLPTSHKDSESSFILPEQTCHRLTIAEIQSATNDFDEALVIGRGGFGKVYICLTNIRSVNEVAIKRLHSTSNQGADEFEAEVKVLSKLRHANLVSLIGYCNEEKEMILAYEFMPNGTLDAHLHKDGSVLSWLQRLKICIGAARGLDYLHTGIATRHGIIHRDMKTSNILLDENFDAKISDFGLAKAGPTNQTRTHLSTGVKGTFGYMDPCYFLTGILTRKSDVYAFGVVLFEVLSGRKAVDITLDEEQWSLASWAQDQIKEGKLDQIIDSRLKGQISKKCLKEFASIAVHCLHNQPKQRPTMAEVVVKLECILSQEKESIDTVVDEGTFMNKIKSFFMVKPDLMPASAAGSKLETFAHHVKESSNQRLKIFTRAEIVNVSNNFTQSEYSATLHETIYKGWIDERTYSPTDFGTGLEIYVRRQSIGTLKLKLEEINHPNLVKLLGYCLDNQELFCVYELIPDAGLDKHLFGGSTSLPWVARLKIAAGAAEGLSFLHRRKHMAYGQFKTSVILLDKNFNARLSDFEMEGSFLFLDSFNFIDDAFYVAPEWFNYQVRKVEGYTNTIVSKPEEGFGVKTEVYAFGVVLLEILTGMKVYDVTRPQGKQNLVKWATPLLKDEANLGNIIDPQLKHNSNHPKGAFKLALLISNCLHPIDEKRPTMEEISMILNQCCHEETKSIRFLKVQ